MSAGKLYRFLDEQFEANINYRLQHQSATNALGELTVIEDKNIRDGGDYIIEMEGNRKSKCYLRKMVNRAIIGMPPRYVYHFTATSPLKEDSSVFENYTRRFKLYS